jgi:hypothetical protein
MLSDITGETYQYRVVIPKSGKVIAYKEAPATEPDAEQEEEDEEVREYRENKEDLDDADDADDVEEHADHDAADDD